MGYTHYWRFDALPQIPDAAQAMIRDILYRAYADGLIHYEHDSHVVPVVTATAIRFNGRGEHGHETFSFSTNAPAVSAQGQHFSFSKTARKPYEVMVMKVLIVLKYSFGDLLTVTSDDGFDREWRAVRREMEEAYGIRTVADHELRCER